MAEVAVLATLGWVAAPMIKILIDKAYDYLSIDMDERRKILVATVIPRLSLAIEKAEKSTNKGKLVEWLNRLKGAYYEAEEAIDRFEYELLTQKVMDDRKLLAQKEMSERGTPISLSYKKLPPILKKGLTPFSRKKIKLKGCIEKLIGIGEEANEFRDLLEDQENASGHRETTSLHPREVFGRDREEKYIVDLLSKEPLNSESGSITRPAIPIIVITGRSSVGKTTLAQHVYKQMHGKGHFNLFVWVHAPRKFNATEVIKNMIEIIMAKEGALHNCNYNPSTSLEALVTQIRSMLGSKKLLLVLDDFWSDTDDFMEQWGNFIGWFTSCVPGSKILATAPSKNVEHQASLAGVTEVETYYLKEIKEDKFLELFMHYAYPSNCHFQKNKFEKIGKKIAVNLKGDPGAAKLVGHELRGKLHPRHWEVVAEKDWLGNNLKARIWSYQQLPQDLQRCFAICGLFPKGFQLSGPFLIDLWMAEGFIKPKYNQEMLEDIGESYLNELVSRFFIERVVVNKSIYYQLHDLLHDLAKRVQGDDFIRIDSTNSSEVPSHISDMYFSRSENIRHIFLSSSMISKLKEKLCLMKNIRTFCVESDGVVPMNDLQEILKNMKKLRVLYLPMCVDDLPDSIGNLKHLRLLLIGGCQPLKKLPDSICKLYHLQMLCLPDCESLPNDFSDLISLRRFATVGETISRVSNVGRLASLQSLDRFIVRNIGGNELHQLENLNQLRGKLCITGLENVGSTTDALKANMQNKKHLEELEFEWNSGESCNLDNATGISTQHVHMLAALQPHPNISALTLKGYGGDKFPDWLLSENSLYNFENLILQDLKNLKKMPSLPPNLTYLVIDHIPQLTYFSEHDLLMKEEILESTQGKIYQWILRYQFLLFVKTKLEAALEISLTRSQYEYFFFYIEQCKPLVAGLIHLLHNIKTMFDKNEVLKLVLPPSLTYLKISSCSITSDALSTSIKSLVSLSQLELSYIQTITFLPSKEVLCSLKNLKSLIIKGCYFLTSLGGLGALTSLTELELHSCPNLNTSNEPLPSSLESLQFLNCSNIDDILANLDFRDLVRDRSFKKTGGVINVGHLSCLQKLVIIGWNGRLDGLKSLTRLSILMVRGCPEIKPSSPEDQYAYELQQVAVDNPLLLKLILTNKSISSIETLVIFYFQGDFPCDEVFQSLSSLKNLLFIESNTTHLPKNLKNLACLQNMFLSDCPNLCELEELPRNLHALLFTRCPALTEKFNKDDAYQVKFNKGMTTVTFTTEEEGSTLRMDWLAQFVQLLRIWISISPSGPPSPISQPPILHHPKN